ncbi:uncharacterized protein MONOS_11249 [Monocercomonoides exilis]|uniref:uncharacterized protein n=1 Tax=Monocercomonoides exilis TaxID=2049356 RepID=UPI00355AC4EA|nr:hypothetical protein MONOS_11249 [Monocercomonoides exilis]|eukprot:MONOS_11249.1-p1 / transcript=MONOS_11249.1 / gene=MONOS_11249 / organism=Monocercomonoides_exilis_PA203 / gene_product=unspecified product / transcript_product=unspecified product / location=Mono_scaffold00554:13311-14753(+) / protein_length=441 / sequence_SO=supercontig / SO=protein_coding / is_pseudo=false
MSVHNDENSEEGIQAMTRTEHFSKSLCELEHRPTDEQRQKIEEMNKIVDGVNKEEFNSIFNEETFNKMDKMIEEKTLSWGNAILLLKHVGYCQMLKYFCDFTFNYSFLSNRFQDMIVKEKMMIEEKDEKLLVDLCECYLLLNRWPSSEVSSIIVPCLLKVASKKEENEEIQKEAEIALLALCNIEFYKVPKELYLSKIKEIIQYHQEHHNLTQLAYQSAWEFLLYRLYKDKSLNEVIVNELHFAREARRDLEELSKCVDWERGKEEEGEKEKEKVFIIMRWLKTITSYFHSCELWNEEYVELIGSIVQVYGAADDKFRDICCWCIFPLREAAGNRVVKVEDLLNGGAIDAVLEEIHRQTLNKNSEYFSLNFFLSISRRAKEKKDEMEEVKRKAAKRKVFEKLEEEGYEDIITSFHELFSFFSRKYYFQLMLKISDYFVYV